MSTEAKHGRGDVGMRRFWAVAAGLVLLGLVGIMAARPGYRWIKAERARRLVERTVPDIEAGRWEEVARAARVAVGLAPHEPRVHWMLARLYSATGQPEGLDHWNSLDARAPLSRADRLAWAGLALGNDRLDVAGRLASGLLAEAPSDPDVLRLALRLAERQGDPAAALAFGRRWLAERPDDRGAQWELGSRLLAAPGAGLRSEGRRLLWPLVLREGVHRESAGALLARDPGVTRGEKEMLRRELRQGEVAPELRAQLDLALEPERRADILAAMAGQARGETNVVRLARTVGWLAENQGFEEVLSVLTPERVAAHPELTGSRIQTLLEAGRDAEARAELDRAGASVPEVLRHCLDAWVARSAGRGEEADDRLTAAVAAAARSPRDLAFVAEYAMRLGRERPALRAVDRLVEGGRGTLDSVRMLLGLAVRLDDLATLRRAADALRVRLPGDAGVRTFSVYLAFLAGQGTREDLERIGGEPAPGPDGALQRAARALGRWRLGEAAAALEELEAAEAGVSEPDARTRFVHALLLAGSQRREAARQVARSIPPGELLGEEQRLLAEAVR